MKNVVVVGSQWGDEGKGKIVDWLSSEADVVVRFQGGHNAGHTLVIDGITYKLRLLPSGIVRKDKISVIGNGVVIDPWALLEEIEEIKSKGVTINEKNLSKYLQTRNIPDPDLLIRTGNTKRLSNFLLWQLAYSEIFFEKKLWPDFNEKDYYKIIKKYKNIKRNFGKI